MVALFGIQFLLGAFLQMRRLRLDKQFIDLQALVFWKRAQVHAELNDRQQVERFLRRHGVRVCQNPIGATDLVTKRVRLYLEQNLPHVMFLFDDRFNYFAQTIDDLVLFLAKGGLILDLKEVAHRFSSLAVKSTHCKADITYGLNHSINQLAQNKAWQVEHRGGAPPGANVRRARSQISEPRIKSEVQFAFECAVDFVHQLECLFQLQPRANRLHPQMIFFVDHDANGLPSIHHYSAASTFGRMLATDQMTLYQHLPVQGRKILQAFRE